MNKKNVFFLLGTIFFSFSSHCNDIQGVELVVEEKLQKDFFLEVYSILNSSKSITRTFNIYENKKYHEQSFTLFNTGYAKLFNVIYENNQNNFRNRKQPTSQNPLINPNQLYAVNLLYECPAQDCPLNSFDCSGLRRMFETLILNELNNINVPKNKKLVYTSIGSEELYEDFAILNQLIDAGYKFSKIILIDNDEYYQNFVKKPVLQHDSLYQFARWFKNKIPTVEIIVYDDLLKYFEDCQKYNNMRCNIVTMLDLGKDDEAWVLGQLLTKLNFLTENKVNGILCFLSKNLVTSNSLHYVFNPVFQSTCYKENCGAILSTFTWK